MRRLTGRARRRPAVTAAGAASLGLAVVLTLSPVALRPALLEPGPPAHLTIAPALLAKLQLLAAGLRTEVALCLRGTITGNTARADDFYMPEPAYSTSVASAFRPCPIGTLGLWHNHPLVQLASGTTALPDGAASVAPLQLCALSERDIDTAVRFGYPFSVVAVDRDTWCWWTLDQVRELMRRGAPQGRFLEDQACWRGRRAALCQGGT